MKKAVAVFFLITLFGALPGYAQYALPPLKKIAVSKEEIKNMADARVMIETKFGTMTLKFFPGLAPGHVKNFLDLARMGFYDGTVFHRVIPGFMIQGGDPATKDPTRQEEYGRGGPGYRIEAEFNKKKHKRGIVSMARSNDPNSAGSQFFICFDMSPRQEAVLDRNYTVFGEVVSGMEVADKIASLPRDASGNPSERVEIKMKVVEGK